MCRGIYFCIFSLLVYCGLSLDLCSTADLDFSRVHKVWVFFVDKSDYDVASPFAHLSHQSHIRRQIRGSVPLSIDRHGLVSKTYTERLSSYGQVVHESRWLNAVSLIPTSRLNAHSLQTLCSLPYVDHVEPVSRRKRLLRRLPEPRRTIDTLSSTATHGASQPLIDMIHVGPVHSSGYFGSGVSILITDSGFRYGYHSCFSQLSLNGTYDFVRNDFNVDQEGPGESQDIIHGTEVLSILSCNDTNPTSGVINYLGVAPRSTYVLAKTEDMTSETPAEEDHWIAGVEWGSSKGIDVVQTSLGYSEWYDSADYDGRTSVMSRALNMAVEDGIVVVVSVGNSGEAGITAPSDSFFPISVGAVTRSGVVTSFSSRGPTPDNRIKPEVSALGQDVPFAIPTASSGFSTGAGTSFAAPAVAGVVALLLEAHPTWTPKMIRYALQQTASMSTTPNNEYGWGIVNAEAALNFAHEFCKEPCEPLPHQNATNGYLFECYTPNGLCNDDGFWICEKGHEGSFCMDDYVCSVDNCAFKCLRGRCISGVARVQFSFFFLFVFSLVLILF